MYIFCAAINDVLVLLELDGFRFVAFADDADIQVLNENQI
jgi:hypothetical protein